MVLSSAHAIGTIN